MTEPESSREAAETAAPASWTGAKGTPTRLILLRQRTLGEQHGGFPDLRLARVAAGDFEKGLAQLLFGRIDQGELSREPDHRFTLLTRTAAYLKYGCLLTGSHPVRVSSLAARDSPGRSQSP